MLLLQVPNTQEEWGNQAKKFEELWNFPMCLGAIDGKHVAIKAPPKQGSMYYNYKNFHSIVLMAIASADYKLLHRYWK